MSSKSKHLYFLPLPRAEMISISIP